MYDLRNLNFGFSNIRPSSEGFHTWERLLEVLKKPNRKHASMIPNPWSNLVCCRKVNHYAFQVKINTHIRSDITEFKQCFAVFYLERTLHSQEDTGKK